jgi:hypothetical protein
MTSSKDPSPPPPPPRISAADLDVEEAETNNLASIEKRRDSQKRFQALARRAVLAKRVSDRSTASATRRSDAQKLLDRIATRKQQGSAAKANQREDLDFVAPIFTDDSVDHPMGDDEDDDDDEDDEHNNLPSQHQHQYGAIGSEHVSLLRRRSTSSYRWRRWRRRYCTPGRVVSWFCKTVFASIGFWVALLLTLASHVLFYVFHNPELEFLPSHAKLSWWCNFFARQTVTLELAHMAQFVIVDTMLLDARSVQFFGSFVCFFALQARGWPFVVSTWGLLDLLLLHGDGKFNQHWLYWSGLEIYSEKANSGRYILVSNFYLRCLLAMVFVGMAVATKRLILAIELGKRRLGAFQPRLQLLLKDVVLISQVAALAQASTDVHESKLTITPDDLKAPIALQSNLSWAGGREGRVEFDSTTAAGVYSDEEGSPAQRPVKLLEKSPSGHLRIIDILDQWVEPSNKNSKVQYEE